MLRIFAMIIYSKFNNVQYFSLEAIQLLLSLGVNINYILSRLSISHVNYIFTHILHKIFIIIQKNRFKKNIYFKHYYNIVLYLYNIYII